MKQSGVLLLAVAATIASGCSETPLPRASAGRGWTRLDLTTTPPKAQRRLFGAPRAAEAARVDVALSAQPEAPHTPAPGSRIHGLEVPAGVTLTWEIDVGDDAYVSFIPLRARSGSCRFRYVVTIDPHGRGKGDELVVSPPADGDEAPETATFGLGRWSGRRAELSLRVDGEGSGCDGSATVPAVWGSPAIYGRSAPVSASAAGSPPNIIMISFDAMRADAIGPRPRGGSLTPAIDRIAASADVWTAAYSTFNVTNPSFASIMTGLYGIHHGVLDLQTPLPEAFNTMAESLRAAGYRTGAVVAAQHMSHGQSGLGQGFDDYVVAPVRFGAETVADNAIDWLSAPSTRPVFAWIHFFDPHTPHDAPLPWSAGYRAGDAYGLAPVASWTEFRTPGRVPHRDETLRAHEALYDAEVAYVDRQVDRLVGFLESRGLLERTILVLVSDHGENLPGDPTPFRHVGLRDATTRVPLIVRRPGAGHALHSELVQTVDLFPMILELAGIEPAPTDGRSLFAPGLARTRVFAQHSHGGGAMLRDTRFLYSTVRGNPFIEDGESLFDLKSDPDQRNNVAKGRPDVARAYRDELRAWLGSEP